MVESSARPLVVHYQVPLTKIDEKMVNQILYEYKLHHCEVSFDKTVGFYVVVLYFPLPNCACTRKHSICNYMVAFWGVLQVLCNTYFFAISPYALIMSFLLVLDCLVLGKPE